MPASVARPFTVVLGLESSAPVQERDAHDVLALLAALEPGEERWASLEVVRTAERQVEVRGVVHALDAGSARRAVVDRARRRTAMDPRFARWIVDARNARVVQE